MKTLRRTGVHLFEPRDEVRFRYGGRPFSVGAPADPEYPTPGPRFTYRLPEAVEEVRIEVRDENGDLVRGFDSAGPGARERRTQGMRAPGFRRGGSPAAPTAAGVHRFLVGHAPPGPARPRRRSRRGAARWRPPAAIRSN